MHPDQALDHFVQQPLVGNGQQVMLKVSRKSRTRAGLLQGWVGGSATKPLSSCHGAEQHPQEQGGWRVRKVFSGLASSSAQPVQGVGVLQDVSRTTELSDEGRTHLKQPQISPSKLVKEESPRKAEVPQVDGKYLVQTQIRRVKSFLRLLICFTCSTVATTSSRSGAGLCHPSHPL